MSHTPGPWEVVEADEIYVVHAGSYTIATMGDPKSLMAHEEKLANARLIAAAPELLDALKDMVEMAKQHWHSESSAPWPVPVALNVIAKVEGGAA